MNWIFAKATKVSQKKSPNHRNGSVLKRKQNYFSFFSGSSFFKEEIERNDCQTAVIFSIVYGNGDI